MNGGINEFFCKGIININAIIVREKLYIEWILIYLYIFSD